MPRRRLRIHRSSSDSEEEPIQQQQQQQQQDLDLPQNDQQPTLTHQPLNLSPPNPNPNPDPFPISDDDDYFTPPEETTGSPIAESLLRLGLSLKREWFDVCAEGLERSVSGFSQLDVATKAKLCFHQFLFSDMNYIGAGVLPRNVHSMHMVELKGPFVLQVDEIVNISCPLKGRYQEVASGIKRCLKLSMTDGVQRVFGMEYRPIKDLKVMAPAGLKVVICNVHMRHGLLMLVPETLEILGGMVQELDAARQRLVDEVNKPPRGKRTKTGVVPSLASRATRAAWPSDNVHVSEQTNSLPSENVTAFQENGLGAAIVASGIIASERTMVAPVNVECTATNPSSSVVLDNEDMHVEHAATNPSSNIVLDYEEMHVDTSAISGDNAIYNSNTNVVLDVEDINMVDEVDHPLILSGDQETPFTYLANLSARWAATKGEAPSVQGKIKCFLTGVKRFQYRGRETYELLVYVDDGSLISEILIDHNVVQKGIGHSPQEVTTALSSADTKKVSDMKETFRQFQLFLVDFEGTMVVEMNETSPYPIALEISQGCPSSDAWLLLRRLKSSPANAQTPSHAPMQPIDISP